MDSTAPLNMYRHRARVRVSADLRLPTQKIAAAKAYAIRAYGLLPTDQIKASASAGSRYVDLTIMTSGSRSGTRWTLR